MFGYIQDSPDPRDWDAKELDLAPGSTDFRLREWRVYDQKNTNSCVGQALAGALELVEMEQGTTVAKPSVWMLYEQARRIAQPKGQLVDAGAQIRDAVKALKRLGCCDEKQWPETKSIGVRPNILARFRGHGRKDGDYRRIRATGKERARVVGAAVRAGYPVIFGVPVSREFQRLRGATIAGPVKDEDIVGYHAMLVTGTRAVDSEFRWRNTWGSGWGENGYCWASDEYLAQAEDAWIVHDWRRIR